MKKLKIILPNLIGAASISMIGLSSCSTDIQIKSISIDGLNLKKCKVNEKLQLSCTILPNNAKDKTVIWSSSNPEIATINENGVVTGIKEGSAAITATSTDGCFRDSCDISIYDVHANSISIDGFKLKIVKLTALYSLVVPSYLRKQKAVQKSNDLHLILK